MVFIDQSAAHTSSLERFWVADVWPLHVELNVGIEIFLALCDLDNPVLHLFLFTVIGGGILLSGRNVDEQAGHMDLYHSKRQVA